MRRRWSARPAALAAFALTLALASTAHAVCDIVPQPEILFQGETGSLNRVFAAPGERIQVTLDPSGCETGVAGFSTSPAPATIANFDGGDLMGWQEVGDHQFFVAEAAGGNPGGWLHGKEVGFPGPTSGAVAPAACGQATRIVS